MQQAQPIGEPFETLTVTLGRPEFMRLGRSIAVRRMVFFVPLVAAMLPAVSLVTSLIDGRIRDAVPLMFETLSDPRLWLSMGAFTLFLMAYLYFVLPIATWRQARADRSIAGPIALAFHDNGVATQNQIGHAFYPWSIFTRVRRSGPLVQLWLGQVKAILVPLTGEGAEGRARALEARFAGLIAAAKVPLTKA